jgi:helix-turn-helix protein
VLQDTDDTGLTQEQYASTEGQYGDLLSAYGGGNARYYAYDGLGSTQALLAPDGSTPDLNRYRAFGLATHLQGSDDNRYDWVGKQGYYDDREAALYLRTTLHGIYSLVKRGRLKSMPGSGKLLFTREALDVCLQRRRK